MEWYEGLGRLVAAAVFAGVIGLDRELRAKPAGLRTNIVVGLAAAAFGIVSEHAFETTRGFDPSRVASEVVSGVGFLGAGAIFAAGGKPHGLTTAAALWGSAAVGLAAGVGTVLLGLGVTVVTILVLQPLDWLSHTVLSGRRREDSDLHVVARDLTTAQAVRDLLRESGVRLANLELDALGEGYRMALVLHGTRDDVRDAVSRISTLDGVGFVSEESIPRTERGD